MSMFSFDVGKKEKYKVVVELDRFWTGTLKVSVNGLQIQKSFMGGFGGKKDCEFEVGDNEKHKIRINIDIPIFMAVLRRYETVVYVDGKPLGKYFL